MAAFSYEYPRPALTVDAVVFRRCAGRHEVLLIRRARPPFVGCWALPGGFVDIEEPLETAAARELKEETGLEGVALEQLRAFGDPGRDPRGRTVSIVYVGVLEPGHGGKARGEEVRGADDAAEAAWHFLDALPPMAFDHDRILDCARAWLESRPGSTPAR